MHLKTITRIGVGHVGGQIGLATQQLRIAQRVVGYVRRQESIDECMKLGVVDFATCDLQEAVTGADFIIFCTPIASMLKLAQTMIKDVSRGALITDVGSVKENVVRELDPLFSGAKAHFVGSHPMAGAEKMGPSAARSDLFRDTICVLTPTSATNGEAVTKVDRFWKTLGARTLTLPPRAHDDLVSRSSHLPHVVAAELANYVLSPAHPREQAALCANGFRDTTRIASGSPEMWRDIAIANSNNLARVLGVFIEDLQEFQHALENNDAKAVEEFFIRAKQRRDAWVQTGAKTD